MLPCWCCSLKMPLKCLLTSADGSQGFCRAAALPDLCRSPRWPSLQRSDSLPEVTATDICAQSEAHLSLFETVTKNVEAQTKTLWEDIDNGAKGNYSIREFVFNGAACNKVLLLSGLLVSTAPGRCEWFLLWTTHIFAAPRRLDAVFMFIQLRTRNLVFFA